MTTTSCDGPAGSVIAPPTVTNVPFLTGTTDLRVPEGAWEGLNAVECKATDLAGPAWPAVDQRGLTRPQGEASRCEAGAVEREQVAVTTDPETPDARTPDPAADSVRAPADDSKIDRTGPVPGGPIPPSIPAGGVG